ncbi:MAG: glutamate-5-semialdehyde dehydrogenase [Nitrospirae bacterium]|nr:glutamate-5-semialdehyde dehydrogenase [Nitrospirota bacterium]MBI5096067.1 glutamate-5-semialdehyde dehydrogenase [Nitrospirota bacterium]
MDIKSYIAEKGKKAREGARRLATLSTRIKDNALLSMADALEREAERLRLENQKDIDAAKKKSLSPALIDRLTLNEKRIREMAKGLRDVAGLPDPVGEITRMWQRPNGMQVGRIRVPIGVIGIIYESRPNVTADSAGLCIKSGNSVFLRGGSEAIHSNRAIAEVMVEAGSKAGLPDGAITMVDIVDREAVMEMLQLDQYIDLIIPRGGEELIRTVTANSKIPVIKHDRGLCHTYVDEYADMKMAQEICYNAKVQRPGTCNAMETMLVHRNIAAGFLPGMIDRLRKGGVDLRGCPEVVRMDPSIRAATEEDWNTEYLDLILNIKIVESMEKALRHIETYGSRHSEAIVTNDHPRAMSFLREVDAAAVFVNASTRLHDGGQFGLGAEIGISTTRIHARGPMGLEELTSAKFIVLGDGQLRE